MINAILKSWRKNALPFHCHNVGARRNRSLFTRLAAARRGPVTPDSSGSGFVRLHILYHASKERHWMIEALRRHGYASVRALYPMLRAMEEKAYLRSTEKREGGRFWREYRAIAASRQSLAAAKAKLRQLFHELIEEQAVGLMKHQLRNFE